MSTAGPDHERFRESAGAYLLRALPESEELAFERHMSVCPVCREEVEDLRAAADALPLAAPPMTPPPQLRARIMAVVEQEAELLRAAGPDADRPRAGAGRRVQGSRRRLQAWLPRPAFALPAMLLVLALGAVIGYAAGSAGDGAGDVRTALAQVDQELAPGARARLEMRDGGATLVAEELPAPPEGRVYQVWLKRPAADPEPTDVLFMPRGDGSAEAAVPGSLAGMEAVLVSHEPPGGSPRPTSAPVLTVQPPA